MTRLTISKCSDWLGGKGIINVLTENYNVPWKGKVDGTILDLDYYGNHSGNKIISPLVEQLIDNTGLSDGNMNKLAQLIFSKYGYNWSKLWEATQLEYNPIHNYDGDEEEILTVRETGTDSVVGQGGGQSKTYGFNSINAVDADESSTDSSNTETKDLQTETTRKFKKGGNLGVTTTQQMMTSEYEYRINYEFFIAVFKDVDKILVIESYGDIKMQPCDVIIQSSYSLPPATENTLGGIKVGDNLTITSDGRLSATGGGGTGGVESVNGKVGKVVLNADDVGAYSQSNQPPYPVTKVNNKTGNVTITASELGAYDADNQPPYPVTSVNGKTGGVTINASEIYLSNSDSVETAIGDINTNISTLNSNMSFFGVSTLLDNWYGTHNVESTVTLDDSIDKYDLIIIACGFQGAGNPDGANKILPFSRVKKSAVGNPFVLGNCGSCYYINNTTLGITPLNNMSWDIYGVRFSNKQYN